MLALGDPAKFNLRINTFLRLRLVARTSILESLCPSIFMLSGTEGQFRVKHHTNI